jgi:hypothetical protein
MYINLTLKEKTNSLTIDKLRKNKEKIQNLNYGETIDFTSIMDCLNFLLTETNKLEEEAEKDYEYYKGNLKTTADRLYYWFPGWVSYFYNWCTYTDKQKAYQKFLNLNITPLKSYITNRKLEFKSIKHFFEKITNSNERLIRNIKDNGVDHTKINIFLSDFETKIGTIKENLRI